MKSFVLALLIVGLSPALAFAQNPFAPSLTLNENPEICSAFQGAWVDVYNSSKKIDDSAVDLKAAFPEAYHISPTENNVNAGRPYLRSHVAFDFDQDGDEEILYFESKEPKHLYWATGFYLYESLEDFESESADRPQFGRFNNWAVGADAFKNPKDSKAKLLAMYKDLQVAQIFKIDGKLYSQSEVKGARRRPYRTFGTGQNPRNVTLDWLRPDHKPTPICEIDFTRRSIDERVAALNVESIIQPEMPILGPLHDMSAGRLKRVCYGTLGHSAVPISTHLQALLYRPHTMGQVNQIGQPIFHSPGADMAREFRFITWGLSDPNSFEVIRELKSHYPQFITDFTAYYQTYFGMDKMAAKNMAELGYRYLLDKVVYGQINYWRDDSRHIDGNARIHKNTYAVLSFGPHNSLEEIANSLVDGALKDQRVSAYILKLGMMTGVDANKLKPLAELSIKYAKLDPKDKSGDKKTRKEQAEKAVINALFLASSSHPEMREYFLERGADVDFPTNYFQKTALMYAAQNNDLDAVVTLLKNDADPNSKTEFKPESSQFCLKPLKRDARTPLMYAAENADATLILTLMEAGADVAAQDTEENNILWYLEQNKILSDEQKNTLKRRLSSK